MFLNSYFSSLKWNFNWRRSKIKKKNKIKMSECVAYNRYLWVNTDHFRWLSNNRREYNERVCVCVCLPSSIHTHIYRNVAAYRCHICFDANVCGEANERTHTYTNLAVLCMYVSHMWYTMWQILANNVL